MVNGKWQTVNSEWWMANGKHQTAKDRQQMAGMDGRLSVQDSAESRANSLCCIKT